MLAGEGGEWLDGDGAAVDGEVDSAGGVGAAAVWGHPPAVGCGSTGREAATMGDWEEGGVMQGDGLEESGQQSCFRDFDRSFLTLGPSTSAIG